MPRKSTGKKTRVVNNFGKGRRILIVDDDPMSLELYDDLLQGFGFATILATDSEAGLAQAHAGRPDLILLDIVLPGIGGVEVMRELKSNATMRHIPVVAVTILSSTGHRERFIEAGFNGYIPKPTDPEVFIQEIEVCLK